MGCLISNKSAVVVPKTIQKINDSKIETKIHQTETKIEIESSEKKNIQITQVQQVTKNYDFDDIIQYPLITDSLKVYKKLGLKRKKIYFQAKESYHNIIEELINQILLNSLKFSDIQRICQKGNLNIMKAMFLRNDSDETILTLILTYIDDYEIITELCMNHKFPDDNYELIDLALSLLRKFRPQTQAEKIQKSIEFLDTVKQVEQLKKVFNSFGDPKVYRMKNAILYAQNCISYFNLKKLSHLLLFKKIAKLLNQQFRGLFLNHYRKWKQTFAFKQLKVPKIITKDTSSVINLKKIELEIFNYNIFHEIAIKNNWEQFVQYSNIYYHQQSSDGRTPFWIFIQMAPISMIVNYIQQYPKELEQNLEIVTNQGLTLIHCLCRNLNLQKEDIEIINKLIQVLKNNQKTIELLNTAYQDQIPLVYYLDYQKILKQNIMEFLSCSLIKTFDYEKLEADIYQIADQILNKQLQINYFIKVASTRKSRNLIKNEKQSQKQEYLLLTQFYQHYIQLAKQIIKNNLFDQFSWVNKLTFYSSHIPYDIGNIKTSLLYTLLKFKRFEQFKNQIESYCNSIQSIQYQQTQDYLKYQSIVQQISRLLFIYQELFNYSELQSSQLLISDTVSDQIIQNPEIILNKVYGSYENEVLADNLYLQYLLRIKTNKEQYNKFLSLLLYRLDKNLFKGKKIKIIFQFQNYHNSNKIQVKGLEKLLPQQDQLIIPLKNQTQNLLQDLIDDNDNQENYENYYDFRAIIEEIIKRDNELYFFIIEKTVIIRSNLLIQNLLDKNSKLHQYYREQFFHINSLWYTSKYINYRIQDIIPFISDQLNTTVSIKSLDKDLYEQFFDWQFYGMKVKFQMNKQIQKDKDKLSLKEQVINNQLQNKQEFWINLVLFDEQNSNVIEYFNRFQNFIISYQNFPLYELISNNCQKNFLHLINLKRISQYELIQILAEQIFFRQNSVLIGKPKMEKISIFNTQVQQLLALTTNINFEITDLQICTLDKFINYLEIETISKFNKNLLFNLIKNSRIDDLIQKCYMSQKIRQESNFSIEWSNKILEIILDNQKYDKEEEQLNTNFFNHLKLAIQRSPVVSKWMVQKLTSQELLDCNFKCNPFYFYAIFHPNDAYDQIDKINLKSWLKRLLLGYFINLDESVNSNKKKLIYKMIKLVDNDDSKAEELFVSNFINYGFLLNGIRLFNWNYYNRSIQQNLFMQNKGCNYANSTIYRYYKILSKQEYQGFIDTIDLDEEEYFKQIKFFILAGLNDQLQVAFKKLQTFQSFIKVFNLTIYAKKRCLEHEFGFQMNPEFEIQIDNLTNLSFHFTFKKQECNFMNFKQNIDYIGTFKYLREELKKKKLEEQLSKEIVQYNDLLDSLIFPTVSKIELNQRLVNNLIQIYITKKSNQKYQYKDKLNYNYSEFLAERSELYIKILEPNIQNCEIKFTNVYYFTPFQRTFFEQLLILLSQNKYKVIYDANKIAQLILKNNFQDQKFNEVIQIGANDISYINQTSKYYFLKCNFLKSKKFKIEINHFKAKVQFLESCMPLDNFQLDSLQINEIAFIKKGHELFDKKLIFNQKYLVAALLSNNLETIIFVMELHKDPVQLGLEQNIFQILTIFSNEQDIITYYNKFVYKKVKDNKRLFMLNNVPILYYIAFKKYSRVFFEVYLKQLQTTQNEQEINNFVQEQLQLDCLDSGEKIYQLALKQKSYFLLNFMKPFIKVQDIEESIYNYNFNTLNKINSYIIKNQIIKEFIIFYEKTNTFHKYFHKLERKFSENKDFMIDDQNQARENQIDLLIKKEQATLMKILGFDKEILQFIRIHYGFSLFNYDLVIERISDYKGNPIIIQNYINTILSEKKNIQKDVIKKIVEQVQTLYILDHPVFIQIIQLFPIELQNSLIPQNFTLENSIALAVSQTNSHQKSLEDFINKQFRQLNNEEYQNREEQINSKIFLMMKLINQSQFNIDEQRLLKDQILMLPEQILLETIQFCKQNNYKLKKEINQNTQEFLIQLVSQRITFVNQSQLWNIIKIRKDYTPLLSEIMCIRKIDKLCEQLMNYIKYLNLNENNEQPEFIIKFENVRMSQEDQQIIIPLEYNEDEIFFNQVKYLELIEQLKQIRLERNIKQNIKKLLNLEEYFSNDIMGELEGNYNIDDLDAPHQTQQNSFQKQMTQFAKQGTIFEKKQTENPNQVQYKQGDIQFMKQNFDFMLELVNNNNNYKVRDQKSQQSQIIFMEYYHFLKPELSLKLEQCTESEFIKKYNGRESISFVISQFYKYHEYLKQVFADKDYKQQWEINFPFYVKDDKCYSEKSLFSTYTIQIVFQKLHEFQEKVKQYATNLGDVEKIQWRISAISTLEVLVSNMVDFNNYNNKSVDILSILDYILNQNSLIMILLQILYCNMLKQSNILSVLRRVYVEFNEVQELPFENYSQEQGFDTYFRFGQTNYYLQQQTLIVRLNILNMKKHQQVKPLTLGNKQVSRNNILKEQQQIDYYYCNIINEEDLLFQIFNSNQLIQYLFQKLEIDRKLQQISQNISQMLNKDIIISVNHQSLSNVLQPEIQQIRKLSDRKEQLKQQTQVKELLINLSDFFLHKSEKLLVDQIQSHEYEYQFQTTLSSLLHSLRQGFNRSQEEIPNYRKIVSVQKAKVVTKIRYPKRNCDKLISLYFGFQLKTNYYLSQNRIGDLLIVVYKNEYHQVTTMLGQLVDNSRQGKLVLYEFDDQSVSTLSQEQFEQYCSVSNKMRKDDSLDDSLEFIENENIVAVILFEKGWPQDQNFINNISNVFITDQIGTLYFIHEQRFARKMFQIQETDSESIKQQLIDDAFGKNQLQTYSQFTVSEIIPIFPNQIIYEFSSGKFKQHNPDVENCWKMIIKINDTDFQIDKMKLNLLNIASYFDSNDTAQYHIKQLTQFKESHNELSKIQLRIKFSDYLNQNPSYYLDKIMESHIAFAEFQSGYETFFLDKFIPKIENSLSFMFDINQAQIKKNLLTNIIKIIEFSFELTQDKVNQLITFENGVLKLTTFLIEDTNRSLSIEVPQSNKIGQFLNQLIINFDKYNFHDLLIDKKKFEISINQDFEKLFEQDVLTLILLSKYLHKLIAIKNDKKIIFKITKQDSKSIALYQFSKDRNEVLLFYNKFEDFSLEDFLLDYLNNHTSQYSKISYLELEKKILNKNQLMLQSMNFTADDFIKKEKYQPQQFELYIHYGQQKIQKLEGRLDPRDFETAFIIIKEQFYNKVVCIKSCQKYSPLIQYLKQNSSDQKCGFSKYVLINGVSEYISLDEQMSKIKIITKNNIEKPLTFYKNYSTTLKAKINFITSNIVLVNFTCTKPLEFMIKSNQFKLAFMKQDFQSEIKLTFLPASDLQMYKFYHTGISFKNEYKQVNKEAQQIKIQQNYSLNDKLLKIIMKSLNIREDMQIEQNNKNINLNQILNNNVLNIQSKQLINQSTQVGFERMDVIEIKDNFGNKSNSFVLQQIVFVHSIYQKIQIVPKYTKEDTGLKIYWEPQIKGIYNLYINNQKVDSYFTVLATQVDIEKSVLDFPEKLKKIPYYQEITFNIYLKDRLQNIYGSIENSLQMTNVEVLSSYKNFNIEQNYSKLSLEGKMEVTLRILPKNEDATEKQEIDLIFKINDQIKMTKILQLEGVSFEKNMQDFQRSIFYDNNGKKIYKVEKQVQIVRANFLDSLLKLQNEKLMGPLMIKFANEQGYDAGGLRKEFYSLIGNELKGDNLKSDQYGYFSMLSPGYYFIDQRFLQIPKKTDYAFVFGKVVANSIFNNHQIGIQFQPQFWKVLFEEKIQFKDLQGFLDPITYQNYESLLLNDDVTMELLCLNFTYQKKKDLINLIPDGQNVMVSKENCQIYLDKVAEYLIQQQYQEIYTPFREGFSTVLDIKILKKYFKPNDMGLITLGVQEIKPEQLINLIKFKGGQDYHISFFNTYVNQLDSKKIKELLQYITGTPTLPSNAKLAITVEFKSEIKESFIPTTRTCFNTIELPLYKNFAEMKQKLDTAISYGLVGFGIF